MADVAADIWVLTETHVDYQPTDQHTHVVYCPAHETRRGVDERWTAIWSRWPLSQIEDPAPNRRGTVAALAETPTGEIVVYGTVIAWANDPVHNDGQPAKMWEVQAAEITRQGADWQKLRQLHPTTPLIVAGDFNQDRDGSGWYGTKAVRAALGHALREADLVCVTDQDVVATGLLKSDHLVDHICISSGLTISTPILCWERIDESGQRLSDHPTVAIDI